jgi:hypothetical protein
MYNQVKAVRPITDILANRYKDEEKTMLSSTGADEVALERSYSVAPQMDVVTAE